ncbi:MAG: hypothetical protein ACERKN_17215 [Velocimicrobium sp.]
MKKRICLFLVICCMSLGLLVACTDSNNSATSPGTTNGTTTDDSIVDDVEDAADDVKDSVTDDNNVTNTANP